MRKLRGTGVALVTPFNEDGSIDFKSLKKLLDHTAKGVDYYVVMGTTGESVTLSQAEKAIVLDFVKKNNNAKLPIVYGIGGNNTAAVLEEIEHTNLRGVAALLSVSPYYNKPSQTGIYNHFKKVADKSPVPVILYNVPGRTGSNMSYSTTLKLAAHKNICGIKEASGNVEQAMMIAAGMPKDFLLISGDDIITTALYSIGASGVISVLANAYPQIFNKMKTYAFAGNYSKASKEAFKLLEINPLMYQEGNPAGIKHVLQEMGICKDYVREPLAMVSKSLAKNIEAAHAAVIKKG